MPKISFVKCFFSTFLGLFCVLGTAKAQQPTRGAFTMPFSHDPNTPNLPAPDTHLPYPNQPVTNAPDGASANTAGLPAGQKPDAAQAQAQAIIASDRGAAGQNHDEEDQVWNDPDSNSTPPGDNPDNTLFNFP